MLDLYTEATILRLAMNRYVQQIQGSCPQNGSFETGRSTVSRPAVDTSWAVGVLPCDAIHMAVRFAKTATP